MNFWIYIFVGSFLSIPILIGYGSYLLITTSHSIIVKNLRNVAFYALVVFLICILVLGIHTNIIQNFMKEFEHVFQNLITQSELSRYVFRNILGLYENTVFLFPFVTIYFLHQKYGSKNENGRENGKFFQRKISQQKKLKYRSDSKGNIYLGIDKDHNKPLYVSPHELGMHSQVIGSTGFGKTASVLLSELNNHIREGRGFLLIDGKGGKDLLLSIKSVLKSYGREDDLYFMSLSYPEISSHYNPFIYGSPTELKDKIIGSQIWTEEFYKKEAEKILTIIFNTYQDQGIATNLELIEQAIKNPLSLNLKDFQNPHVESRFREYCENHKNNKKNYAGIAADLMNITDSLFGRLFTPSDKKSNIDILDAYKNNKIIFLQLPTSRFEETAKRIGRIILYDLKCITSFIESEFLPEERKFFPVLIDEFASFAFPSFIDFINKARSSGMSITVLHQSMGDLKVENLGNNFAQQISENTNVKLFLRVDDPDTIQYIVDMIGTRKVKKYTYQTQTEFFFRSKTGGASERETDEYIINPNEFRNLKIGEAIIYIKSRSKAYRVALDYISPDYEQMSEEFEVERSNAILANKKKTTKISSSQAKEKNSFADQFTS